MYDIYQNGGPQVQEESDKFILIYGPLKKGEVAVTGTGNLALKYIIHTVGPIYGEGSYEELVLAYTSAFKIADELNCKCVAAPAISAGAYDFPLKDSAKASIEALLKLNLKSVKNVINYLYDEVA